MPSVLLLNGPNLNLLGTREPKIYGTTTLQDVERFAREFGERNNVQVEAFQSNHEGHMIDRIHAARNNSDAIIINPGAFTHTSVAIRDALLGVAIPFIEVHTSNIHAREQFRHHSYFSDQAVACIIGLGAFGYEVALKYAVRNLVNRNQSVL
ncbi:hypothetical protein DTO166G4_8664 [Paecilomyces variotii]|nr:hypothetical protein DTO166G4_8664 [Paecilomyces variotii]KAJ9253299.1 hypothetical protein DTO207G8_4306 [Paecilomyces variotii]KAJ9259802.1 hypothetical protein DTO195F2_4679 [Paecilomyces variotii]KAJ9357549.1 hypothetical protein DTO027B9_2867 [Paecilomyces variotii]